MLLITKNVNIYSIQRVALCNRLLHFLLLSPCHRLTAQRVVNAVKLFIWSKKVAVELEYD